MPGDGLMTALSAALNALFVVVGFYIYIALARQIGARPESEPTDAAKQFGIPEVVLATLLASLFVGNALIGSAATQNMVLSARDLLANAFVSLAFVVIIFALLAIRGIDAKTLAGFSRLSFFRTLTTGAVLLFAAYPLIFVADLLSQRVLGVPPSRQGIVEMFSESQTLQQRVIVIVLAVGIAPLVEEVVFRFFFYGILKRYFGRTIGLLANAALFAAVHAHLPSAAPLFVLGSCFTLAFEWSGSIIVPMTMHALFNSFTLTVLAFPDIFRQ